MARKAGSGSIGSREPVDPDIVDPAERAVVPAGVADVDAGR